MTDFELLIVGLFVVIIYIINQKINFNNNYNQIPQHPHMITTPQSFGNLPSMTPYNHP